MPPRSYADVTKPRGDKHDGAPLAYSVARKSSVSSNLAAHQLNSHIQFSQPFHDSSLASTPGTLSPPFETPSRSPLDIRRPSIAQILSSSYFPDSPSGSSNLPDIPKPTRHVDPAFSEPSKKKKRPRNRRRRSSQTRDHGDFLISRGTIPEPRLRPMVLAPHVPLLEAILVGKDEHVKELIVDKSNINDEHDHKPLQLAALVGSQNIVQSLLDSGHFDINVKDSRERTALFVAASRGHDAVMNILLESNARPLSFEELKIAKLEFERYRAYLSQFPPTEHPAICTPPTFDGGGITAEPEQSIEDPLPQTSSRPATSSTFRYEHLQKLEIGTHETIKELEQTTNQSRQEAQKNGEWVRGPSSPSLLPSSGIHSPLVLEHSRNPGFGFPAPVIEFDFSGAGRHRVIRPIPSVDQLLYGTHGVDTLSKGKTPESHNTCRWYHLPANNIGWAEDLIRKIYEKRSPAEQKKRDMILMREPFCDGDSDNKNPFQLGPNPQSRSLRPVCRNMILDRDGAQRLSSALALRVPYVHWETEKGRAEMHEVMVDVREARKSDIDSAFQRYVPPMKIIEKNSDWSKDEKLLWAYLYHNPPIHPRRTLDQFYYDMLEDTELRDKDQVISRFYREVWKKNHNLPEDDAKRDFSMLDESEHTSRFILNTSANETAYDSRKKSSYSGANAAITDSANPESQSRLNFTRSFSNTPGNGLPGDTEKKEPQHVMMVDQLWLWILDENTIISCFPRHWNYDDEHRSAEDDAHDVLQNIYKFLASVNRPPLESIYDLAQLIVYNCLVPFCKNPTPYGRMQILDVYKRAIASVTDKETRIFNQFADESKEARRNETLSNNAVHNEKLYNIDQEIDQLKEVKDIQDELHILSVLLGNQITVLKEAKKLLGLPTEVSGNKSRGESPKIRVGSDPQDASYSSEKDFHKLLMMVTEQEERRKELEAQAKHANNALNHLLDLKQKQANVSEARSARITSESTKQQGNIMVLFTLVTIIFAPLSLMSTMFSLRIVEFPDKLHMDYVLKYMFAVSVSVIVPLIGLVIYTTRVTIRRLNKNLETLKWFQAMRWNRKKKELREKLGGSSVRSDASTADLMDVRDKTARVFSWKLSQKSLNGAPTDTEKGLRANLTSHTVNYL